MMQHLLEDRFGLATHRETREEKGYALVIAEGGPRLKPAQASAGSVLRESPAADHPALDEDGFDLMPDGPGVQSRCMVAGCRYKATSVTMEELAASLPCRCKIEDRTHLSGKYAFVLTANMSRLARSDRVSLPDIMDAAPDSPFPDVFRALREQLGLRLESAQVTATVLRIDRIQRVPVEN